VEKKNYVVYVTETRTKKYFVNAESEEEAREKYLVDGLTSTLYDKDSDRKIIYVGLANEEQEKSSTDNFKYVY
jgi:hypothetical protein|tara:strand:+ start:226 stop:444 length:219 start_codon:yes stop_codon:yes gene_type:complete